MLSVSVLNYYLLGFWSYCSSSMCINPISLFSSPCITLLSFPLSLFVWDSSASLSLFIFYFCFFFSPNFDLLLCMLFIEKNGDLGVLCFWMKWHFDVLSFVWVEKGEREEWKQNWGKCYFHYLSCFSSFFLLAFLKVCGIWVVFFCSWSFDFLSPFSFSFLYFFSSHDLRFIPEKMLGV